MSERSRGPIAVKLVTSAVLLWMTLGCAPSPQPQQPDAPQTVTCGYEDGDNFVVDPDACDDDGDGHGHVGHFLVMGGHHSHTPGQRIPRTQYQGSSVVRWNDTAARTSAGLPSTGKVTTGQRTTTNSGIGKGSTSGNSGSNSSGG